MSDWSKSSFRFARAVAYRAGRLVANVAARDGQRRNVGWAVDTFFAGIVDELDAQHIPKKVAANMFGMSHRTYQRRTNEPRPDSGGVTTSNQLLTKLATPASRETLTSWFPASLQSELGAMLLDLLAAGKITRDDGVYRALEEPGDWTDARLEYTLYALHHRGEPVDPETLAQETGVPASRWVDALARLDPSSIHDLLPEENEHYEAFELMWDLFLNLMMRGQGIRGNFFTVHRTPQTQPDIDRIDAYIENARGDLERLFAERSVHTPGSDGPQHGWLVCFGPYEPTEG